MSKFLFEGPDNGPVLLLTHGSGVPMDSPFMNTFAATLAENGVRIARFEFEFMAQRREGGNKRPPPRAEKLIPEFIEKIEQLSKTTKEPIFIGGKSLGCRVATMLGRNAFNAKQIKGVVCLGYPFHPPKSPDSLRTAHFADYDCPTIICQGEKDPFGQRREIETYTLPPALQFVWAPFGNHDLTPPKRSGLTGDDNIKAAANAVTDFIFKHSDSAL